MPDCSLSNSEFFNNLLGRHIPRDCYTLLDTPDRADSENNELDEIYV